MFLLQSDAGLRYKEISKCKAWFAGSFKLSRPVEQQLIFCQWERVFQEGFWVNTLIRQKRPLAHCSIDSQIFLWFWFVYCCNQVTHTVLISAIHHLKGWQWTSQGTYLDFNLCFFILLTEICGIWNGSTNSTRSPTKVAFHWWYYYFPSNSSRVLTGTGILLYEVLYKWEITGVQIHAV